MNVLFEFITTETCETVKISPTENTGEPQNI